MASHVRRHRAGLLTLVCVTALGCGGGGPQPPPTTAAALTAADRTHVARAAAYAAEVARYREIASHDRQLSAAYARWTPPASATKDWNATLKARSDARAATADQIAGRLQALADFHAGEAAKELAR